MKTLAAMLMLCSLAGATVYTIKSSGGSYTSISACAAVAVAGDSCVVYASASPQSGWTQGTSGTSGNLITFIANTGDSVTITSAITISSQSYIRISGFNLSLSSNYAIVGNGTSAHNQIDHNTSATTLFRIPSGLGSNGSDNYLGYNTIDLTGHTDNAPGFQVYGNRNLFEHNEIKNGEGDCYDIGGMNVVVRYTYCHDINGASGEHIDFVQVIGGGTAPTLSFSLIEHNVEQHCYNDSGNCHALLVRTGSGPVADTVIYRFNYAQDLDGGGVGFGGSGDDVPNGWAYNNTLNWTLYDGNGACITWQNAATGAAFNNICYNVATGDVSYSPFYSTTFDAMENGNLVYTTGYAGGWASPYSTEATYSALHSVNPLFANYPTDGTLLGSSPAIGAGVALTTVTSGCNSSSLTLANAHGLQPGWAGTNADWIRVGTSSLGQISSIDYGTNIATMTGTVSCTNGDSVYLYKDSGGTQVLFGSSAPTLGAYPYNLFSEMIGNASLQGNVVVK
jgi:hypothetical protein